MEGYGTPRARPAEPISPSRDASAAGHPSASQADATASATASREGWPWQFQLNARREAGRGQSPMAQQLRALSSGRTNMVNATARASYESAILSAVRRQMDAFEEKWEKKLRQERRDPLSVSTIDRLVERVSALEAPQPRLEKRLAELDGKVKGLSDELQGQIRQVHLLDDRRWEWKQKMEEDLTAKCQGLQQQMQALVASNRSLSLEEDSRQQRNWHSALEEGLSAAARERNAMQQEVHEGFVNVCERLAALEVKSLEELHPPVAAVHSPGNDVATEMLSKRLEDLEKKLEDALQDNFDIHQRHAAQEEQIRSLRTRFENREEQLRALGERVERSDWDVKLSQIRQALQEHHQERTLHSEKLELLSKRVEYQEQVLEDARFNGAQRPDALVEEELGVGSSAALALLEDQVNVMGAEMKRLQEAQEEKLGLSSLVNQLKDISPKVISHEKSIRRLEERHASESESKLIDVSAELAAGHEELKARLELLEQQALPSIETLVTRQDMADEVRDLRHRTEENLKDEHLDELKNSWEQRFQQLQSDAVKGLDVEYRLDRLEARNKVEDEEFLNFRQELQQRMEQMATQVKSLQVSERDLGDVPEDQILKKEGNWSLNGSTGRYTFDSGTRWLSVGDQRVGRFICQRIQDRPLSWEVPNFYKLTEKRLSIVSSEIMEEIHRKENDGALFVLPSQLNGAEYPSHEDLVYDVEDYKYDNTGGPRGQLAVHPAASQFLLDNAANVQRTGGLDSASGLLSDLKAEELKVINGYLKIEDVKEPRSSEILEKLQRELHTLRPLIMENLLAQGVTPDKRVLAQHRHRVGLVYASAVPVNAYLNQCGEDSGEAVEFQKKVAELFLVAQYYAALTYAAETALARGRRRRVYLMPLGGGVFNNPWDIIATSMAKALQMLDDDLLVMLDISVLAWKGEPSEEQRLLEIFCRLNRNYHQVSESLPAVPQSPLVDVTKVSEELRSEVKLSLQDFRQSLELAALKDEAKEVQLQETQRELERKLKSMEEELAETKVQLTLWRSSTEEASIERIEATSALSVATRDAVGVLEKDLTNLKERLEGANGDLVVSEALGHTPSKPSHDQEEGLRELQTQVTNLSERLNAFVAAQIQGHESLNQPELAVLAETLQKDEREEQEAHARLLLRIDELCSHLSKAAEGAAPWVKLELLGRQVEEMQRAEKQMEAKLESFVTSLAP